MSKKIIIALASVIIVATIALIIAKPWQNNKKKDNEMETTTKQQINISDEFTIIDELTLERGKHKAQILTKEDGTFYLTVSLNGELIIEPSQLGITTESVDFTSGLNYNAGSVKTSEGIDKYNLTTGSFREIEDAYKQISFQLVKGGKEITLEIRAYDDGIAYRYVLNGETGKNETILKEASEFVLNKSVTIWSGYDGAGNYEFLYNETNGTMLKASKGNFSAPVLVKYNNAWMLLTEAAVFSQDNPYCTSMLKSDSGKTNLHFYFGDGQGSTAKMTYTEEGTINIPWRVVIATDNLNDLISASIITSLNPACDEELFADSDNWIKTGKVAWSWWSEAGDDPVEYAVQKDYIDFAAENGWEYVCIDFGWCLWENYEAKIKELVEYANDKGVAISLWYGVNNDNHWQTDAVGDKAYPKYSIKNKEQAEKQLAWCASLGVKAVKIDYFERDDQATMQLMYDCAAIAAKYKINVLFHGCTAPKGEQRTFPNVLGYEAVRGAECYKWNAGPTAKDSLLFLFSRNVAGGMDFTPVGTPVTQFPFSTGFTLAQIATYESGFINVASSIYKLEGYSALPMINRIPAEWDETILLDGYPGKYSVIARRNGEDWILAGMAATAYTKEIQLDFLGEGNYKAYIYADNEDGSNVVLTVKDVTKTSVLNIDLKKETGVTMLITKGDFDTTTSYDDNYTFYEAEDPSNTLSGNAKITLNQFASGMYMVNGLGELANNSVTFNNIMVSEDGVYEMHVYFYSGVSKHFEYTINGTTTIRTCGITSGMNTLGEATFYIKLNAGSNTIKFGNCFAGAPNLDRIAISKAKTDKPATDTDESGIDMKDYENAMKTYAIYGPEDAVLTGGAKIENGGIGWLGNSSTCKATFTISASKAGTYTLKLSYYTGEDRNVRIIVNDGTENNIKCENTGSYALDSATSKYIDIELKEGNNTIVLYNPSGWCPNIASIGISEEAE